MTPAADAAACSFLSCQREPGLHGTLCPYHNQRKARHGSPWRPTIQAKVLEPYRRASRSWLKRSLEGLWPPTAPRLERAQHTARVKHGLGVIHTAIARPYDRDPRWLKPEDKARNVLAGLLYRWDQETQTPPTERLIVQVIAVKLALRHDVQWSQYGSDPDYGKVQWAKAVHRMASGYHRRWGEFELHRYSRSSGLVLRHLGKMVEEACDWITEDDLYDIHGLSNGER